jgi:uncharacterized protein YcbK (DUF882 family)
VDLATIMPDHRSHQGFDARTGLIRRGLFVVSLRVRGLVAGLLAVGSAVVMGPPEIIAQSADQRTISIYNIHTKETVSVVYRRGGQYVPAAMKQINHIMRDWRQNEPTDMEPGLVDIMWEMHTELGSKEPIHLISGFRSRKTNDGLRESSGGQAKNSQHIQGKAADIHFPDVPIKRMRYSALVRERGGVGYYPTSAIPFVHVDTARVRHWPPMPRYELALLFPNGQSKHVPGDGNPITKDDVRVAQSKHRELAVQIAEFFDVRRAKPDPNRTVLAGLTSPPVAVPAPVAAVRPAPGPQLASLGGPSLPLSSLLGRKEAKTDEPTSIPPVAAPPPRQAVAALPPKAQPPVPTGQQPAAAGKPNDPLGALMSRELAQLNASEAKPAGRPATAPAAVKAAVALAPPMPPAPVAPTRVASNDPAAGLASLAPEKITGETLKSWPSGYAQAPAFDEEHPEELSYRPFAIGPILTEHSGDNHPVLARMQAPDTGRVFEMLDEPDRLFPLTFRPGQQVAEMMWAGQFNGSKVGSDTLMARLKGTASALIVQRQVATTYQK